MTKKDLKRVDTYNIGGWLGTGLGIAASFIPGVGPAVAPLAAKVGQTIGTAIEGNPYKKATNAKSKHASPTVAYATQGFQNGGSLNSGIGNTDIKMDGTEEDFKRARNEFMSLLSYRGKHRSLPEGYTHKDLTQLRMYLQKNQSKHDSLFPLKSAGAQAFNTARGMFNDVAGTNFQNGGSLRTMPVTQPMGNGAIKYNGAKHEQGGIPIDASGNPVNRSQATAEVEGGETKQGDYIFSDTLKVPGKNVTFADEHENLIKTNAPEEQIQKLIQMQEQTRSSLPKSKRGIPEMQNGGNPIDYISNFAGSLFGNRGISKSPVPTNTPMGIGSVDSMGSGGGGGFNIGKALDIASYVIPSATRLGAAAFTPKPEETPRVPQRQLPTTSPVFADERRRHASAFRANPNQAGHSQYTQAISGTSAREAEYRNLREEQNVGRATRADEINQQAGIRDQDNLAQDTAARMRLVSEAVELPITAYRADQRGKQEQISNAIISASRIQDPVDREKAIKLSLSALGLSQREINDMLSQYGLKYGGKLKKGY